MTMLLPVSKPAAARSERSSGAFSLPARTIAGALLSALLVGGCAPDAFLPDAPYEDFLNRVQSKCLYQRIGDVEITSDFLQTPYFLDLTSRFYNGEIPRAAFVENLQGAYAAEPGSPGVNCLLAQMPSQDGPVPPAMGGPLPPTMSGTR
jgi:hypothetical protein